MNPYDFVRVDWQRPGERRPASPHDRFSGIHGRLGGTITTLTPLFIGGKSANEPQPFLRDKHGRHIIPGSSLKGLFRNLVETVGGGAWWFFGSDGRWGNEANYRTKPSGSVQTSRKPRTARRRLPDVWLPVREPGYRRECRLRGCDLHRVSTARPPVYRHSDLAKTTPPRVVSR